MLSVFRKESNSQTISSVSCDNFNQSFSNKYKFGKCKICGDKATGVHYGVESCEGCKGFFKRSVANHEKYVCNYGRQCQITPQKRKICKYCRYQICVKAGMSMSGIRMGRIPNSEKSIFKIRDDLNDDVDLNNNSFTGDGCSSGNSSMELVSPSTSTSSNLQSKEQDLFPSFSLFRDKITYFYDNCIEKCSTVKVEPHMLNSLINDKSIIVEYDSNLTIDKILKSLFSMVSTETYNFIRYARALPEIDKINIIDFKNIVYDQVANCISLTQNDYFVDNESYLFLDKDVLLDRKWIFLIFGQEFTDLLYRAHSTVKELKLSKIEMALMIVVILTSPGISFVDSDQMNRVHEFYKKMLEYEFNLRERDGKFYESYYKSLYLFDEIKKFRAPPLEYINF